LKKYQEISEGFDFFQESQEFKEFLGLLDFLGILKKY
jgi:hypothetical protein